MLNTKTLRKLIIATVIFAVPVVFLIVRYNASASSSGGIIFLPNLLNNPEQISKIVLQDNVQTFTLQKLNGNWVMVERDNYPVMNDKVEELLFNLADLRIVEPKTNNRQLYAQLDLDDIKDHASQAILLIVQNSNNEDLLKLYVGKREGVRLGEEYKEHIFVRKENEDQTWLVQGMLPLSKDFRDWVEQPLIGLIESDQIRSVQIKRPQDSILISKTQPEQEDFALESFTPQQDMVLDLDAVNTLPFQVAELEFKDVQPANNVDVDWGNSITTTLTSFPGVQVVLNIVKHEDKILAKAQAEVIASDAQEALALQTKVQAYNNAKQSWIYELSPDFYKFITVSQESFQKSKETNG